MRLLTAIRGIVLARILQPSDFGIVGAAMMLQDMVRQFGEMGIGSAAVYFQKKSVDVLPVAVAMKFVFSCFLTALIFLLSPLWGAFFNHPEVASVTQFSALFILTGLLSFPANVQAQIDLRFKKLTIPTVGATALGCTVAIALAYAGFSYWSILWGMLTTRLVEAILLIRAFPWKIKLIWRRDLARELWSYGLRMLAASALHCFILQVDNLMVGKLLGLTALGYYVVAFRWAEFGSKEIVGGIGHVIFPTFVSWQDTGRRPQDKIETIIRMSSTLYLPISIGMFVIAPEFVRIVLGERWLPVVEPLQVLCIAMIFRSIGNPIGKLLQVMGRPELEARFHFGMLLSLTLLLVPFTLWFGLVGASFSVLVAAGIWYFLARVIALRQLTGHGFTMIGRALLPGLAANAVMIGGLSLVKTINHTTAPGLGFLFFLIAVGAVLYGMTIYVFLGKQLRIHLGIATGKATS